jgi:hypothetical protein
VTSAASLRAIAVCLLPEALTEWEALASSVKSVLNKLLKKCLDQLYVAGAQLHGATEFDIRQPTAQAILHTVQKQRSRLA